MKRHLHALVLLALWGSALTAAAQERAAVFLDFGTAASPVADGFVRVSADTIWAPGADFGWVDQADPTHGRNAVDAPVDATPVVSAHSGRTVRPGVYTNALSQDHVEGTAPGTLRVNLQTGDYIAWFVLGAGGPGERGKGRYRVWDTQLQVGGKTVRTTFPGMVDTRIVTVPVHSNGVLEVHISTRSRWLVNALALVPADDWETVCGARLARYRQDIEQLPEDVLSTWEHRPHRDNTPMPAFSAEAQRRGLAVYHRSYLSCIWPNTVPLARELEPELRAFATPGEYEPLTVTLLPLKDTPQVRVEFSDLVSAEGDRILAAQIDVRRVRYLWVKPNYVTDGIYYRAPDVLMPFSSPVDAVRNENLRVWATVYVTPKTPGGIYTGQAHVLSRDKELCAVPIRFRVVPIVLEKDPDTTHALYYRHPYDDAARAPDAFSRNWYRRRAEEEHRDLVRHGMNGITLGVWSPAPRDGTFQFDFDALEDKISLLRAHGMVRPLPLHIPTMATYRQYVEAPVQSHLRGVRVPPQAFFDTVSDMVRAIETEREIRGWPEFLYYPIDEPSTQADAVAFMVEVLKAIKRVPGVRTYVTADPAHEQFAPMAPYIDVWCCQPFNPTQEVVAARMLEKPGLEYWCYPNHVNGENDHTPVTGARMTYGFGFWRSGFRALIPWIYSSTNGSPWNCLDGSAMDFLNRYDDDGSPIPVTLYEAYREGIDDGRYVTTLSHWVERAEKAGRDDLVQAAQRDLTYVWDAVEVQLKYKHDGMWDPEAFDVYRWILAQRILQLQTELQWR